MLEFSFPLILVHPSLNSILRLFIMYIRYYLVYYITDVYTYIHIRAYIYKMHITFVHNVYNFLYISQRCMFQNILLRGIHNQKSWEISGGDRDRKEQPGTLKKKKKSL